MWVKETREILGINVCNAQTINFQFSWNATAWNWFEMIWLFSTFSTIHSNKNVSLEIFLEDRYTLILWTFWRRHSREFGGYASSGSQPSVSHFLKLIPLGTNKKPEAMST